ncbi:hypothetical protein OHA40_24630 [Nocardia sp. NBC_00508]|uniref:hypothetical protein n=1 Tax=Nocardia sp. NBC_00508 TaxID=2975992 RepID=UPI002E7FFEF0|nr:hypothetical protein [Nocardia sp. NBC_00508]WUD64843.1 hypothetical protein OHA40_24630 [Nocardia sp. NBC_00508]
MSWIDQHARTDIVHTVLSRAAIDPTSPDLFAGIPDLERLFGGAEGLLLTLRYRWNIHIDAKLELGLTEVEAYLELAAEQPVLRAVLDAQYRRRHHASEAMAR